MSFSEAPYTHLELKWSYHEGKLWWYCSGCGAEGNRTSPSRRGRKEKEYTGSTQLGDVMADFEKHLRDSHEVHPPKSPCRFTRQIDGLRYHCDKEEHPAGVPHSIVCDDEGFDDVDDD